MRKVVLGFKVITNFMFSAFEKQSQFAGEVDVSFHHLKLLLHPTQVYTPCPCKDVS